ncbi:group II intron reverse transcriptase/maturase [Zoogloea sp.]|uniref:group II intron reverse transcriptase/maturase n=1 Tax=Zoogloea sp. TaxID=49181 RepID=UPI00262B41AD|nr:group II intron reverse transcriptase/maturase [Zoogloea sp.]MDD3354967.1 group II intron reverse transcriptase/maturase [Zoogloea sp.]
MSLPTLLDSVRTLQTALQTKAKNEPAARFYSLWDKVCREDVLHEAYRRCRANRGAPGVDGERFEHIEEYGRSAWLERLRQELTGKTYHPRPLLRVWIPKASGGERPLGIPCIRDRVVQMAVLLVMGPIFEADLLPWQYGFRTGLDAKMALRRIHFGIADRGAREVVDADLSDYFNTIPHGDLMRCVARRIADGTVLSVIREWLNAPVVERSAQGERRSTEAKDLHRGTPQGGIISPLLANLYFRRFMLAWYQHGYAKRFQAEVVNYADDFVILCRPGQGEHAMGAMRGLMDRLGLTVNEKKTRLVKLPDERFDFLGYTVGRFYGRDGRPYWGTRPSRKSIKRLIQDIHDATTSRWNALDIQSRIDHLNPMIRGWAGYFSQGPVSRIYRLIDRYAARRLRIWLMRRRGKRGTGYRQYADQFLYETLGLIRLLPTSTDRANAKV